MSSTVLKNLRREAFCQHYAGDCWGNATEAYRRAGYAERHAKQCASRLLSFADCKARIASLRDERIQAMAIDRAWILERRKTIAETAEAGDRLRALDQLEKSLGLSTPERTICEHQHSGAIQQQHTVAAAPETLASLWALIAEVVSSGIPKPTDPGAEPAAVRPDPAGEPV